MVSRNENEMGEGERTVIENNINVGTSKGDECFVCERPTLLGERVIRVTFSVYVVITKISKTVEAHVDPCAKELQAVIGLRIRQAEGR